MNKKDCSIVRDLLPNYVEELVSKDTKKFVENHINNCLDCNTVLTAMQTGKKEKVITEKKEEQIEFKHLKKYSKKMFTLKIVLVSIFLIIFMICGIFFLRLNYINNIIQDSYDSIQELKKLDKYSISMEQNYISYIEDTEAIYNNTFYYCNNKYKKEMYTKAMNQEYTYIYYGEVNSNRRTELNENDKTIVNTTTNYYFETKESLLKFIYSDIFSYSKTEGMTNIIVNSGIKIQNERYNGKDCYVLNISTYPTIGSKKIWIEKESMLPIRIVEDITDRIYSETIITLDISDFDENNIKVPNTEGYTIKDIEENIDNTSLEVIRQIKK